MRGNIFLADIEAYRNFATFKRECLIALLTRVGDYQVMRRQSA